MSGAAIHSCDGPNRTLNCINPLGRCRQWCIHPMAGRPVPRSLPAGRGETAALTPTVGRDRPA